MRGSKRILFSDKGYKDMAFILILGAIEDYLRPVKLDHSRPKDKKTRINIAQLIQSEAKSFLFGASGWKEKREYWCSVISIPPEKIKRIKNMTWEDFKAIKKGLTEYQVRMSRSKDQYGGVDIGRKETVYLDK